MSAGNDREFIDHLQKKEKGGRSMKCPLLTADFTAGKTKVSYIPRDCLKEECAWWVRVEHKTGTTHEGCSIAGIFDVLYHIAEKMPHEEQFRT
ncbi:hypothetical protein ES708_22443 [subsurface metagenome]